MKEIVIFSITALAFFAQGTDLFAESNIPEFIKVNGKPLTEEITCYDKTWQCCTKVISVFTFELCLRLEKKNKDGYYSVISLGRNFPPLFREDVWDPSTWQSFEPYEISVTPRHLERDAYKLKYCPLVTVKNTIQIDFGCYIIDEGKFSRLENDVFQKIQECFNSNLPELHPFLTLFILPHTISLAQAC